MSLPTNKPLIVRCSHCKNLFPSDTFNEHICELSLRGTKRIPVINFLDVSYKGHKLMTGMGTDGILYAFEVVPREAIPMVTTSDDFLQRKKSDKDFTEPGEVSFPHSCGELHL